MNKKNEPRKTQLKNTVIICLRSLRGIIAIFSYATPTQFIINLTNRHYIMFTKHSPMK